MEISLLHTVPPSRFSCSKFIVKGSGVYISFLFFPSSFFVFPKTQVLFRSLAKLHKPTVPPQIIPLRVQVICLLRLHLHVLRSDVGCVIVHDSHLARKYLCVSLIRSSFPWEQSGVVCLPAAWTVEPLAFLGSPDTWQKTWKPLSPWGLHTAENYTRMKTMHGIYHQESRLCPTVSLTL